MKGIRTLLYWIQKIRPFFTSFGRFSANFKPFQRYRVMHFGNQIISVKSYKNTILTTLLNRITWEPLSWTAFFSIIHFWSYKIVYKNVIGNSYVKNYVKSEYNLLVLKFEIAVIPEMTLNWNMGTCSELAFLLGVRGFRLGVGLECSVSRTFVFIVHFQNVNVFVLYWN